MLESGRFLKQSTHLVFAVEPVRNLICTLGLIDEQLQGADRFIEAGGRRLPIEPLNSLVGEPCNLMPFVSDSGAGDWPTWVTEVRGQSDEQLRARWLSHVRDVTGAKIGAGEVPSESELASDRDLFEQVLRRAAVEEPSDVVENSVAHALILFDHVVTGESFGARVADVLQAIWEAGLRDEWERRRPEVESAAHALATLPDDGAPLVERVYGLTRRTDMPEDWNATLERHQEVIFVPSPHIGPYLALLGEDSRRVYLFAKARIPSGAAYNAELERSDLLVRLTALSDETRLSILEIAHRDGEVTTAAVMERLGLSQSSASRHLIQLNASGLLIPVSAERTRRYRANPGRIREIAGALTNLLG